MIMRLLSIVTKKALLAFGYPRLANIDPTAAEFTAVHNNIDSSSSNNYLYNVGATKVRMSSDIPACQLFYPAGDNADADAAAAAAAAAADDDTQVDSNSKSKNENKFIPYFRKEAVTGMIEYLNGFGDGLLQMLEEKKHPCSKYYNCNPLKLKLVETNNNNNNNNNDNDNDNEDGDGDGVSNVSTNTKFPLILFSHGLGGNMELYTQLCTMIASHGYIVVAIEHEDGSASYASSNEKENDENENENQIPYKRPLPNIKVPYSRQKVLIMRTPMLEQRVNEIQKVYDYFVTTSTERNGKYENENENENYLVVVPPKELSLVQKIISITNTNELHLVGHSFGGATQLLAAQKWSTTCMASSMASMESMESKTKAETEIELSLSASGGGEIADSGDGIATTAAATDTATAVIDIVSTNIPPVPIPVPVPIPKSIMVLDAWCFALSDEVLNNGIINIPIKLKDGDEFPPPPNQTKIISILSQDWALTNSESKQTLQFLSNCNSSNSNENSSSTSAKSNNNVYSYYARNSVHQSFSDTECWLPTFIARKLGCRGMKEDRHITIRSCVKEFISQTQTQTQIQNNLNDNDSQNNNILIPFPYK